MKIKQLREFDSETGEIETEATYTYQTSKRKKGTFCISSLSEIIRLIKNFGGNKVLEYAISNINYLNEFSFSNEFINSFKNRNQFYVAKKKLLDSNYIYETNYSNVYTLNVDLISRTTSKKADEIRRSQQNFKENYENKKYRKNLNKLKKDIQHITNK